LILSFSQKPGKARIEKEKRGGKIRDRARKNRNEEHLEKGPGKKAEPKDRQERQGPPSTVLSSLMKRRPDNILSGLLRKKSKGRKRVELRRAFSQSIPLPAKKRGRAQKKPLISLRHSGKKRGLGRSKKRGVHSPPEDK